MSKELLARGWLVAACVGAGGHQIKHHLDKAAADAHSQADDELEGVVQLWKTRSTGGGGQVHD